MTLGMRLVLLLAVVFGAFWIYNGQQGQIAQWLGTEPPVIVSRAPYQLSRSPLSRVHGLDTEVTIRLQGQTPVVQPSPPSSRSLLDFGNSLWAGEGVVDRLVTQDPGNEPAAVGMVQGVEGELPPYEDETWEELPELVYEGIYRREPAWHEMRPEGTALDQEPLGDGLAADDASFDDLLLPEDEFDALAAAGEAEYIDYVEQWEGEDGFVDGGASDGEDLARDDPEQDPVGDATTLAPLEQEASPEEQFFTYRVLDGDRLWDLAEKFLGKGYHWKQITELNRETLRGGEVILPGMELRIPKR